MTPVTSNEHFLMLSLFAVQMQACAAIWEKLTTEGIAESSDIAPFSALAASELLQHVPEYLAGYAQLAKQCGVTLPEEFPPIV
jgi:hypothetical protein